MQKEIFINESMGETRIAIKEDNQLVEVYVEKQDNHRMVGNVYKGNVENVLPGMQAAFVDVGYELNAFLPFSEIGSDEFLNDDNSRNQRKDISCMYRQSSETVGPSRQAKLRNACQFPVQIYLQPRTILSSSRVGRFLGTREARERCRVPAFERVAAFATTTASS